MRKPSVSLGCSVLMLTLLSASGQQPQNRWKWYTNVRFQYAVCYPENLMVPQGETVNSAGNTFLGSHGEKLVVYGENTELTLAQLRDQDMRETGENFGPVSYIARLAHGYVISAGQPGMILYTKTFLSGSQTKSFTLVYPRSEQQQYDLIAKGLNVCFADLNRDPHITLPR